MFSRSAASFAKNTLRCNVFNNTSARFQSTLNRNLSSKELMEMEDKYGAHNYHPLDVVFAKAKGIYAWDPEGKRYIDMLSAYSAVNQGHCHPKIINAIKDQLEFVTLSSRAFYNNVLGQWEKRVTELFGYERVLPMNTGAEAVETALKLARRWGYEKKGIPEGEALIIACSDNFHGRTYGAISLSTSDDSRVGYGPFLPGILTVPYDNVESLRRVLSEFGSKVAGFIVEPIQGEAGVAVPSSTYLKECYDLCKKHNVLFIADEIQTGIGRTGKMLCTEHSGIRPDVVTLAKALTGGVYPMSCVLADTAIMEVFTPGTHGSTYGGNPVACAASMAALDVLIDEKLIENADAMGKLFRSEMGKLVSAKGIVKEVRGMGLLNAMVIDEHHPKLAGKSVYQICQMFKERGVLAKQTRDHIIRFAPPLVINEQELREAMTIIAGVIKEVDA